MLIDDHDLQRPQRDIRNFTSARTGRGPQGDSDMAALHATWQREFAWHRVRVGAKSSERLKVPRTPIEVRAINQSTGAASLDYRTRMTRAFA